MTIVFKFNIKNSKDFTIFDQILCESMFGIARKNIPNHDYSFWLNLTDYDIRLIFFYLFKLVSKRKKIVGLSLNKATPEQLEILKGVQKDISIKHDGDIITLLIDNKHKNVIDIINREYKDYIKL